MNTFVKLLEYLVKFNDKLFAATDAIIEKLPAADWFTDALIDSTHMLLFLFITFFIIEIIEHFYSDKIKNFSMVSASAGPVIGALLATFPQCGFSIIAAGLYTKKLITLGTLIAIFISTSDESIPVLLANPQNFPLIMPLIGTKIIIAIVAGYTIDAIAKSIKRQFHSSKLQNNEHIHEHFAKEAKEECNEHCHHHDIGCCNHSITYSSKQELIIHPIMHTLHIFMFILLVTVVLNYFIANDLATLANLPLHNKYIQIFTMTLVGLIPNCAASVAITLLFIKGSITLAPTIAGLCASSGLGLLVLLRDNKNIKDTIFIICLIFLISIFSGVIINLMHL